MAEPDLEYPFTAPALRSAAVLGLRAQPEAGTAAPRPAPTGWMLRAVCRSEDPELFFPVSALGASQAQVGAAKAVCARCPVRPECLSYATAAQVEGIWGGTTREERWPGPPSARRRPAPDRGHKHR